MVKKVSKKNSPPGISIIPRDFTITHYADPGVYYQPCLIYGKGDYDFFYYGQCLIMAIAFPFEPRSKLWKDINRVQHRGVQGATVDAITKYHSRIEAVIADHFQGFSKTHNDTLKVVAAPTSHHKGRLSLYLFKNNPWGWSEYYSAEVSMQDLRKYAKIRLSIEGLTNGSLHNLKRSMKLFAKLKSLKKTPSRDFFIKVLTLLVEGKRLFEEALLIPPYPDMYLKEQRLAEASSTLDKAVASMNYGLEKP